MTNNRQLNAVRFLACLSIGYALLGATMEAKANGGVPALLPMQGRLTDSAGAAIVVTATVNFRIYPPTGTCFIYEDTQSITPNTFGIFSTLLGNPTNTTGPANSFTQVFSNDSTLVLPTSCGGTNYTPSANDWRRLEIIVNGTALSGMQTIGASAFALNAVMLDGKSASSFIQSTGNVTQPNLDTLTGTGDASALHNHDSKYVKIDGTTPMTGSLNTTGSISASGATSKVGIGTSTPTAEIQIVKDNPTILIQSTTGSNGTMQVDFNSGSTQRGAIKSTEAAAGLQFYSGSTLGMSLDPVGNLIVASSLSVAGTVGLGKYTTAQETTMIAGLTAGDIGTTWMNSDTKSMMYWDGTVAKAVATGSSVVSSVTAGIGMTNSGTPGNPVLDVNYGTAANTALQGNQAFGGDVSGTATAISVDKIKGVGVDFTVAPTTGQIMMLNGSGNWAAANPPATGVTTINGLSTQAQTLTTGATGTAPAFNSAVATHTLNIPLASGVGVTSGTISNTDFTNFSGKVDRSGDSMTGLLTLSADPTANLEAATKQYVDTSVTTAGGAYIKKDGSVAYTGAQSYGGFNATNLADPVAAQDASTKNYVDTGLATKQNSLGFTPINKAGDTAIGTLTLAAQKNLQFGAYTTAEETTLAGTLTAADIGRMWYNSTSNSLNFYDGTAVKSLGVSGTGLLSLNGLTGNSQTYAIGTTGTAPNFSSVGTVHTLNVPMASGAGVTAGLLSKTDYDIFNNKENALGYTPVNKAGDSGIGNLSMTGTVTLAADPVANLEAATKQYVDNSVNTAGGAFIKKDGTVAYTGDQAFGGFKATGLADPAAAQDAATKNYVDTSVTTAGGAFIKKDGSVVYTADQAFGGFKATGLADPAAAQDAATKNYTDTGLATKVSKAGDTGIGTLSLAAQKNLQFGSYTTAQETTLAGTLTGADIGRMWYNSTSNSLNFYDGTSVKSLGVSGTGLLSLNGLTGNSQTFAIDAAGTAPAFSSAGSVHTLSLPMASGVGVTAGLIAKTDYDNFAGKVNKAGDTMTGLLTLSADPTGNLDAATKQYVDTSVSTAGANFIKKDGSVAFTGDQSLGSHKLTNVTDPAAAQDAATKNYVDTSVTTAGGAFIKKDGTVTFTADQPFGGFKATGLADPAAAQDAATKNYTDTGLATKITKAGDTGIGTLSLAAQKNLQFGSYTTAQETTLAGTLTGADIGRMWYNSTSNSLNFYDGTSVKSLGVSGTGLLSLNGLTGNSQTFAIDAAGTAPAFSSAGSVHTLSLPMASGVGVTAGLIAKTDYDNFAGKVNKAGDTMTGLLTLSADPTGNLDAATKQYVDTSVSTAGANFIKKDGSVAFTGDQSLGSHKLTNVTDPAAAQDAATKNYVDTSVTTAGGAFIKKDGTVTFTADQPFGGFKATGLADPAAAQDAATKNYTDTGLATKITKAGDTGIGTLSLAAQKNLQFGTYTTAEETTLASGFSAADNGRMWYNTTSNTLNFYDGAAVKTLGVAGTGILSLNGLSGNSQTFAYGTSGTAPAFSSAGSVHTLNIPMASTAAVTGGLITKADYDTFNGKQDALGFTPVNKAGDTMTGLLTLSGDPTANLESATKQYVDSSVSTAGGNYIKKDGTVAYTGDQSLGSHKLTNVTDPAAAQDAATKNYVDTRAFTGDATGSISGGTLTLSTVTIAKGGTGQTTAGAAFNALSPLTTKGDLLGWDSASNVRIPAGTNGQVLSADSTQTAGVKWVSPVSGTVTAVTANAPLSVTNGTTTPDLSVAAATATTTGVVSVPASNGLAVSGPGALTLSLTNDTNVTYAAGALGWTGTLSIARGGTGLSSYTANALVMADGAGTGLTSKVCATNGHVLTWSTGSSSWTCAAPSTGSVSSVDVAVPAYMTSTGGPITSSGSITLGFGSQTATQVFAAPTGSSGAPTFRNLNIGDLHSTVGGLGNFLTGGASCTAGQALTYSTVTDTISCNTIVPSPSNASTLASTKIWVGDAGNLAQAVSLSGDATLSNTGALTLGTVSIAKGGTGQTTAAAAFDALAPTQTSNGGKYLTTDGTTTSWATISAGSGTVTSVALTAPAIFSVSGSPITTTGTLAITASGTSGGIPYFNSATTMASSGALSANQIVLGGGAGASPTVLAAGTAAQILTSGGAGVSPAWVTSIPVANGGTGQTSNLTQGGVIYGSSTTAMASTAAGSSIGQILITGTSGTGAPSWLATPATTGLMLIGTNAGTPTWSNTVTAGAAGSVGLVVKAAASPTANVQNWSDSSSTAQAYVDSSFAINAPAFYYTSDRRLKENFKDIKGLETILALHGVSFTWKRNGQPEIGLIAQEVEKVLPDLVKTDSNTGMKAVKYGNIVAPLIESVKELYGLCKDTSERLKVVERNVAAVQENQQQTAAAVHELKKDLSDLKKENEALRAQMAELKEAIKHLGH